MRRSVGTPHESWPEPPPPPPPKEPKQKGEPFMIDLRTAIVGVIVLAIVIQYVGWRLVHYHVKPA